jgi:hypothetical protein
MSTGMLRCLLRLYRVWQVALGVARCIVGCALHRCVLQVIRFLASSRVQVPNPIHDPGRHAHQYLHAHG